MAEADEKTRSCGLDLDATFAYETQKIVRIQDSRLGLLYLSLVAAISVFIVGFQILYNNEHFMRKDVRGTARVTIQQPTRFCNPNKPDCLSNFHSLRDLPYCLLYDGNSTKVSKQNRQQCIFADQHTLAPNGMLQDRIFIPTRIDTSVEQRGCTPSEANGYTCDNEFKVATESKVVYVADIERYTLLFSHTYHRDWIRGNNAGIQGHYYECESQEETSKGVTKSVLDTSKGVMELTLGRKECNGKELRKPIKCISDKCIWKIERDASKAQFLELPHANKTVLLPYANKMALPPDDDVDDDNAADDEGELRAQKKFVPRLGEDVARGRKRQSAQHVQLAAKDNIHSKRPDVSQWNPPDEFGIPDGDVFKLSKILELCGLDLDRTINAQGEPLREAGTVIEVEVIYQNLQPFTSSFGYSPIRYTYKFTERPMIEMKTEMLAANQPNFPKERIMENRHGIYIMVKVTGEFGFFSLMFLLVMLTAAAGLIGVAVLVTDKLAVYAMPLKDEYYGLKYQTSEAPNVMKLKQESSMTG